MSVIESSTSTIPGVEARLRELGENNEELYKKKREEFERKYDLLIPPTGAPTNNSPTPTTTSGLLLPSACTNKRFCVTSDTNSACECLPKVYDLANLTLPYLEPIRNIWQLPYKSFASVGKMTVVSSDSLSLGGP